MSKDGLKDEHEKFYEIINTMPSGFVKLRINDDGTTTVVFVNSTFLGMTDMTEEEFRKLYDVDCLAGVHPDDILRLKEMMDNIHVG